MGYLETQAAKARNMLGRRVEIPVHYDMWARGARYGVVTSIGPDCEYVRVQLDMLPRSRRFKVWRLDFDYVRVI